jgi:hypothetical protein
MVTTTIPSGDGTPVLAKIIPVRPAASTESVASPAAAGRLRRTLGRYQPSRRTLGRFQPSRRTLGRYSPSRRTLGRSLPSRRTLGVNHPSRRTLGRGSY